MSSPRLRSSVGLGRRQCLQFYGISMGFFVLVYQLFCEILSLSLIRLFSLTAEKPMLNASKDRMNDDDVDSPKAEEQHEPSLIHSLFAALKND